MIDADLARVLTDAGVSADALPRLERFDAVQRPGAIDEFFDKSPAAPVTLTVGQVQSLRGALRVQVNRLIEMVSMQQALGPMAVLMGMVPHDMNADRDLALYLDLEDALAATYADSTEVIVPDTMPDDWTD